MASSSPKIYVLLLVFFLFRCLEKKWGGNFIINPEHPEMNQANVGGFGIPRKRNHHAKVGGFGSQLRGDFEKVAT